MAIQARKWILPVLLSAAMGALAGCGDRNTATSDTSSGASATNAVSAVTLKVAVRNLPAYADFPGSVAAADRVQVASRLMGYVQGLRVHEGQSVRAGALLLTIDPSDVKGGIAQARASLDKAQAALADAAANERRYKALFEQQAVPAQRYQQVHMAYQVAQGNVAQARAALKSARAQLHYAEVRAPFAGVVVAKSVSNGQLATPGQPLLTLDGAAHLQVVAQMSDQAFRALRLGQSVTVEVDGLGARPQSVSGTVERLVDASDPMTHTHTVKIALPAGSPAQSGDYARVRVAVGVHRGIVVPASAVHRRGDIDGVFVVDGQGVAYFRMVRLGPPIDGKVEVLAGLVSGDRIVVSAKGRLDNGVRVQTEDKS
ncbi:efflux RND transporter periplasmic adaptor subunit [Acidihalobacter prosperus]|uniref:Uncharacterized protein n=1 Tax=Acidihalobacter prosperus TaxID=160660 RepID=A0A1A6C5W7_9GAMM|nr:efflux RND transporter periplasmic adaptor subunit [Acidihalobacter prosperus]OBS09930.1 hypothetical protein Thpro_020980 [Acidihalobacter prosperus]